jgi:hypothetical protein
LFFGRHRPESLRTWTLHKHFVGDETSLFSGSIDFSHVSFDSEARCLVFMTGKGNIKAPKMWQKNFFPFIPRRISRLGENEPFKTSERVTGKIDGEIFNIREASDGMLAKTIPGREVGFEYSDIE